MIEDLSSGAIAEVEVSGVASFYQHGWHSWCTSRPLIWHNKNIAFHDPFCFDVIQQIFL